MGLNPIPKPNKGSASPAYTLKRLIWTRVKQTGVLLHMLPTVGENGRFVLVAVGDSPEIAEELYKRVQSVIKQEAEQVTTAPRLPLV